MHIQLNIFNVAMLRSQIKMNYTIGMLSNIHGNDSDWDVGNSVLTIFRYGERSN